MKKLARLGGLKYTAYGIFCLLFSVTLSAIAALSYAVKNGLFNVSDIASLSEFDRFAVSMRYSFGIISVSCGAISALLLIFVMLGAGYKRHDNDVHIRKVDKLPYELYIGFLCGLIFLLAKFCFDVLEHFDFWNLFVVCPCLLLGSLFFEEIFVSGAIRYKADTIFKNTILWRVFNRLNYAYKNFEIIWKVLLFAAVYFGLTYLTFYYRYTFVIAIWIVISFVYCAILGSCVVFIDQLKKGAKKIADGDLEYKVDTTGMFSEFASLGDTLNHINDGISKAVAEKTRSERFRTELITNVSHDIKTPLTSIINYVDLLKRTDLTDAQREQYLDVLDRQSAKLKKLIVDLVEASKAITGNVSVNIAPTNLTELLNQAAVEYSDKFESSSLTPFITAYTENVTVLGDGRLIWRIFDNIMSNICKYSLEGTRVYIDVYEQGNHVAVIFKNISRSLLNISSDELAERFVRGDSSRSTEGSGLGLSIATSLAELLNGKIDISVDGDLFKATLLLPICQAPTNEQISLST